MDLDYSKTKIYIQERFESFTVELWMHEHSMDKTYNISYDGKKIIKTEIDPTISSMSSKHNPFLKLPMGFAKFFFDSLIQYNCKNGNKSINQNFSEGKLEATDKHLEDMRSITNKLIQFITEDKLQK